MLRWCSSGASWRTRDGACSGDVGLRAQRPMTSGLLRGRALFGNLVCSNCEALGAAHEGRWRKTGTGNNLSTADGSGAQSGARSSRARMARQATAASWFRPPESYLGGVDCLSRPER